MTNDEFSFEDVTWADLMNIDMDLPEMFRKDLLIIELERKIEYLYALVPDRDKALKQLENIAREFMVEKWRIFRAIERLRGRSD